MIFGVGDRVFLHVSLLKGVMRFERRGKHSPRYIRPFEIFRIVGEVVHKLALPPDFVAFYPSFLIYILRRYIPYPSQVLKWDSVQLDRRLTFVEEPKIILASVVRRLRTREIPVVKVQ